MMFNQVVKHIQRGNAWQTYKYDRYDLQLNPLTPDSDWRLISPYSYTRIKCKGHENKPNDHQFKKVLIAKIFLFVSNTGNVKTTVWK